METQKSRRMILGVGLAVAIAIGFVWWRLSVHRHVGYDAILVDASDSQSLERACGKVGPIVRVDLNDLRMARGGTIALFAMGNETTAYEPVLNGTFTVPDTTAVLPGEGAAEAKRKELESKIVERCKTITPTTVSPVFGSFKRIVEFLQRQDTDPDAYLVMHAITDGEETQVKEIVNAFREKPGTNVTLPMVIDNSRVRVEICGVAETIGTITVTNRQKQQQVNKTPPRSPEHAARQAEVWIKAFSQPILVKPFCVSASEQTAQSQQR